ncbi:MAG: ribonuclease Z [Flavobacteriaceae bacterium]|nr:MAG: ribonuclease Z [Flavobacteriaceae bacterium]
MSINLTILGCHSATPRVNAHPTSQFLTINNRTFLIDCGEGTQVQLRKFKLGFTKIQCIFISHLHGDHYFGLIGLISTFMLHKRNQELHIYGPKGIKEVIILQLKLSKTWINFGLYFHELTSKSSELIYEDEKVEVHTIPLKHRVYTNGFLFKEKEGMRKLNMAKIIKQNEIDVCDYRNLQLGKDFIKEDGSLVKNDVLTLPPTQGKSYAFCSDTMYDESIVPIIKNCDLLYHETTFLKDLKELAKTTMHSTAFEAATIAKMAEAKQLIIGHFSSRYTNLNDFKQEAQEVFKNTALTSAGKEFQL